MKDVLFEKGIYNYFSSSKETISVNKKQKNGRMIWVKYGFYNL
jgi:hypothetical protein